VKLSAVWPFLTRRARSGACAVLPVALVVSVGGAVGAVAVCVYAIGTEGLGLVVWLRAHGRVWMCRCAWEREDDVGIMESSAAGEEIVG